MRVESDGLRHGLLWRWSYSSASVNIASVREGGRTSINDDFWVWSRKSGDARNSVLLVYQCLPSHLARR